MRFLSHGPEDSVPLDKHLTYVATRAQQLADQSTFTSKNVAYYAGLFHDLGKLNPYYQELFSGKNKTDLASKYNNFHSPYSCWIAKYIFKEIPMDYEDKNRAIMIIDGHHSTMKKEPGNYIGDNGDKRLLTAQKILENWNEFTNTTLEDQIKELPIDISPSLNKLKYQKCLEKKQKDNGISEFLECGFLFSCVLQADRGSFSDFKEKTLDDNFKIDTSELISNNVTLSNLRSSFQLEIENKIDISEPITVINAPTGSGKTKAFLDLIKRYNSKRVFYFSPLLALTDDIGKKISKTCKNNTDEILVYQHIFTGSLDKKNENTQNMPEKWNFDFEAFNEKIVITTTQRLLMIIYSNHVKDKLKLASLRDSLLIIDEVQTLPKFLLKNLIDILNFMSKHLNIKTLLVSATIPYELSDIPKITMRQDVQQKYLKEKNRKIIKTSLDIDKLGSTKTLVMLNTRKNAKQTFEKLKDKNVHYISAGITKNSRVDILDKIDDTSILVSTQVVEAGVDISFDQIWRQMAPLDNIIQVMGRLDRESKNKDSVLYLFDVDSPNHTPYSSLEFTESQKIIKEIDDSTKLYEKLSEYYESISTKNQVQKNKEQKLHDYMSNLEFGLVWETVKKHIGENFYDSVFIPKFESWDMIKMDLLSKSKTRIKKHAGLVALLPIKAYKMKEFFDEELYENNILYPKKDKINELYDDKLGLDKWIK